MPELPEVETVRIGLEQSTIGRVITEIVFQQFADVMGGLSSTSANDRLSGQMILGVRRRAKYLIDSNTWPSCSTMGPTFGSAINASSVESC